MVSVWKGGSEGRWEDEELSMCLGGCMGKLCG